MEKIIAKKYFVFLEMPRLCRQIAFLGGKRTFLKKKFSFPPYLSKNFNILDHEGFQRNFLSFMNLETHPKLKMPYFFSQSKQTKSEYYIKLELILGSKLIKFHKISKRPIDTKAPP